MLPAFANVINATINMEYVYISLLNNRGQRDSIVGRIGSPEIYLGPQGPTGFILE